MKQKGIRIVSIIACMALLIGCVQQTQYPGELPASTLTPPPTGTDEVRTISAQLYFCSQDSRSLEPEIRMVDVQPNESNAHAVIAALKKGPSDELKLAPVIPDTLTFDGVELSGDICNVYFSGVQPRDGIWLFILRAAIAATINSEQTSRYVDIYINHMQPGYRGRPLGAAAPIDVTLETYILNMQQEYGLSSSTGKEADVLENRNAALYFSDVAGELLLCDVRTVLYDSEADGPLIIAALLIELMKGPLSSEGREWLLPSDMRLKKTQFVSVTPLVISEEEEAVPQTSGAQGTKDLADATQPNVSTAAGEPCIVELYFDKPQAFDKQVMAYASLVYTVTSFLPSARGVRIYLGGELIDASKVVTSRTDAIDGLPETFVRTDFSDRLGELARLCFPDKNGQGLYMIRRSMAQNTVNNPQARLKELFTGAADPGVRIDAFRAEDIRRVSRHGNMLVVDFEPGFYDRLVKFVKEGSELPANTRARMFVFSVVNTLCMLPGVEQVWMLEDGKPIDKTVDMIYLGGPLFENPGLTLS